MPPRFQPEPLAMKIGARIRALRREKKMSIARIAKASGLSKGHVSNMEHGLVLMTVGTVVSIASALDTPPYLLVLFPEDEPLSAVIEHMRLAQPGDTKRAAQQLHELVFGSEPEDKRTIAGKQAPSSKRKPR
jgi:transcriptional regulator with XRE-family HTH domain